MVNLIEHDNSVDFDFLCHYVKKNTGIHISKDHSYLLSSRLSPVLKNHNLRDFSHLISTLRLLPKEDLVRDVLESMTINETFFFRGKKIFDTICTLLMENANAHNKKTLRVWSSATSSGQEAYSIAMLLEEHPLKSKDMSIHILATDISEKMIERAKDGLFLGDDVRKHIPPELVTKYFSICDNAQFRISDILKSKIHFMPHNLLRPCPKNDFYDLILCRNVLIYFDDTTKEKIIQNIYRTLSPKGLFLIGGTEILKGCDDYFSPLCNVEGGYQKK